MSSHDIYARGGLPFSLDVDNAGLRLMTARKFRTWAEKYLTCYRISKGTDGQPAVQVGRTMTDADAEGLLCAEQIHHEASVSKLKNSNAIRMPVKDR